VSRVHLLVLRSRHVFDARSTNGTTLNASALNPEDLCKMEDGDIVVIANLKVLRFQAGANPKPDLLTVGVIDEASRGLFISGTTRSVTVLAPAEYYVTLDPETGLRLGLESATGCVARLAVPHEGNLTLEILREDVEFLAYLKRREGNFGWEGWSVRPGKPFDPSGAHFSCNGLPLQIVDLPTPSGDDEQKLVKSEEDDGEDLTTPDEDDGEKEDPTRGNSGLPH